MLTYSLTSVIMLRRDSSSLIPRDNVRFLGEPLLSTVTECMFNVLYLLLACVGAASEALGRSVYFLRSGAALSTPRLELRKAVGSRLSLTPPTYRQESKIFINETKLGT